MLFYNAKGRRLKSERERTLQKRRPKIRPPQAPPGGGDVPDGIQNAGGWGDGRRKI